jgi:hypothetical protein
LRIHDRASRTAKAGPCHPPFVGEQANWRVPDCRRVGCRGRQHLANAPAAASEGHREPPVHGHSSVKMFPRCVCTLPALCA